MKLSSFRQRLSALLVGSLVSTTLLLQSAFAAPTGSPYRTVMDSLLPNNYFMFDEDFGSVGVSGTVADNGSSPASATYISVTTGGNNPVVAFNDGTQNENTSFSNAATVGRTVSPGRTSKFSNNTLNTEVGAQEVIDRQYPGLQPAYFVVSSSNPVPSIYPVGTYGQPVGSTGTTNRQFEANSRGAVRLGTDNTGWATDLFTFAAWVTLDDGAKGSTSPRFFDRGGNTTAATGTAGQMLSIGQASSSNGGPFIAVGPSSGQGLGRAVSYNAPGYTASNGDAYLWDQKPTLVIFSINNTGTLSVAEKLATAQFSQGGLDLTFALKNLSSYSATNAGGLGVPKLGFRDLNATTGNALYGNTGMFAGEMDEVGMWNRILAYDEKEALFNAGTRPAGGLRSSGTGDNFNIAGSWVYTAGDTNPVTGLTDSAIYPLQYPQQHGNNSMPYQDINVNPSAGSMTMISPVSQTPAWRTTVNSITQSGTFQMGPSMQLRSTDTAAINGQVYMQGLSGTWKGTDGSSTFVTMNSRLWTGGAVTFGAGSKLKIDSPENQIVSQSGVTIDPTATFELTGTFGKVYYSGAAGSLTGTAGTASNVMGTIASGSGASLSTVIQARSQWGQGTGATSTITRTGSFGGRFASVTLPGSPDSSGLRVWSSSYENNATDGVGVVDSFKIGLAAPGDIDFNSQVTPDDILSLAANGLYNTSSPANWREGDFNQDGVFDSADMLMAGATGVFNNGPYSTTEGTTSGTAPVNILYNEITGNVSFDTKGVADMNGFILKSASNGLLFSNANLTAGPFVTTSSGTISSSFAQTFANGYNLGDVLAAGLAKSFLLSDLTFTYSQASGGGVKTGQLVMVPEPASVAALAMGGVVGTLLLRSLRRRKQN